MKLLQRTMWRAGLVGMLLCMAQSEAGPLLDRLQTLRQTRAEQGGMAAVKLPVGVTIKKDIAYGPFQQQGLDVYAPAHPVDAPIMMMVHGGAWRIGDKSNDRVVDNKVAHWVSKGLVFVSVNYRMLPEARPDIQMQDVARALAFVQQHAADWGANLGKVILMGHSAGAHLVALLASDPAPVRQAGGRNWLATVALDSAAFDIPAIMRKPHFGFYDEAFGQDAAYWRQMSPLEVLSQRPYPFLAVCSTRRVESCDQANTFIQKAGRLQGMARLLPVDMSHAEINEQLGLESEYTRQVDQFLSQQDARLQLLLNPGR
ncbi:alpha/beta hydrolase fold domain-containing protein [Leeia oryzae]|uniref:alpha/beta hydrolase fold domain-containing protein n=1 Tax=Leeia oryzae TaxID=356662 RepID=UPI00039A12D9|nr:alpha/beta hydrolase [Leeia oryzae]